MNDCGGVLKCRIVSAMKYMKYNFLRVVGNQFLSHSLKEFSNVIVLQCKNFIIIKQCLRLVVKFDISQRMSYYGIEKNMQLSLSAMCRHVENHKCFLLAVSFFSQKKIKLHMTGTY